MDIFHAIFIAVLEGLTEFLPVSSSGHMAMASHVMLVAPSEFLKAFQIALQFGSIAAVVVLYWRTFLLDWEIDAKILAASVPAAVIGLLIFALIRKTLIPNPWCVVWAWFLGGAVIILIEHFYPLKNDINQMKKITFLQALLIGACQALAVIPGVSRSAAVIISGQMLGIERKTIVEFSFLSAVPAMLAVIVLELIKTDVDVIRGQWAILVLGFAVAFVTAWAVIKFFRGYVKSHNLTVFALYRVLAAMAAGFYLNLLLS